MDSSAFFPSKRYSAELVETCFQLFLRERSLVEIARLQNVPYGTLRGWSMRGKWQARRDVLQGKIGQRLVVIDNSKTGEENTGELGNQRDNASPSESTEAIQARADRRRRMTFDEKQAEYYNDSSFNALRILDAIAQTPTDELVQKADKISKLDAVARKALALEEHKPTVVVNVGLLNDLSQRRTLKAAHATTIELEEQTQDTAPLEAIEV